MITQSTGMPNSSTHIKTTASNNYSYLSIVRLWKPNQGNQSMLYHLYRLTDRSAKPSLGHDKTPLAVFHLSGKDSVLRTVLGFCTTKCK